MVGRCPCADTWTKSIGIIPMLGQNGFVYGLMEQMGATGHFTPEFIMRGRGYALGRLCPYSIARQ